MRYVPTKKLDRREVYANALVALAIGVLLGVLVAVPYDRLLGLSGEACVALRSVVAVGLLARQGAIQRQSSRSPGTRPLHAALAGNLERIQGVLRIKRSTGSREVLLRPNGG